ncbi:hypothetical protein DNI29_06200 [Hymenobacter sediminis]|uniref:DUF6438 domain-containing protein n=1 Tax=Hymenobacter sediminis TaxID=2218621 RepID=UPI000DA658AD|nr:DUF6438 domain-containing protein [Hymenobacter sediminis]RPD50383.1 hypothetical protein DNI29_06200 [Hymenobacter sediminis]
MRLLLLLLPFLLACSTQAQQPTRSKATLSTHTKAKHKQTAAGKPATATQPVITLERTPCFGRCPHYRAHIFPDGRVQYEGFRYAPTEGKAEFRLPLATVQKILQQADEIGFQQLQNEYTGEISDLPSTILTIRYGTTTKTVKAEQGAPASLRELLAFVSTEVESNVGSSVK